jgi:hypothetical protein
MTAACGGIENAIAELLTTPMRAREPQRKAEWAFRTQGKPGFENLALVWPEVWIREAPSAKNSGSRKAESTGVLFIQYPNIPYGPFTAWAKLFITFGFISNERSFQVP